LTANDLLGANRGKPRQSNLRRASSTVYYALFHCLAKSCADLLVGGAGAARSKHAWRQVYRALEHNRAKNACNNQATLKQFPKEIEDFGNTFVISQDRRHKADYDPSAKFYKEAVQADIDEAKNVIIRFTVADIKDRRAFAAFVLFKQRP